ncbi:MAG: translation initiation factor IF-3 [Prochlorothrix sp.]|nr:translation initiation factor IF-3 [Prochlorothrix sp.]
MEDSAIVKQRQPINQWIKAPQVLLIDHENTNHGIIDTRDALKLAQTAGLDLVIVSDGKDQPVARIMDYGKHQYQQKKRHRQSTASKPTVKEVKLRPNVGESDYGLRISWATEWLSKGNMVRFQVRLRGREHHHRDRATQLLERVIEDLSAAGKVQSFDRRALMVQLSP